jgi:OPT family oligopeptide transporter
MRYPSVAITALVAQLLALPAGKACERIFPIRYYTITLPTVPFNRRAWTSQFRFSLNPGPFNIKEHCLITVMANVVAGGAYATDIIAAQRTYYSQQSSAAYQLLLVISTQMIGFSLAGVCRRFLVWPSSMIWPATLVNTALFNALHSTYGRSEKGYMSRERFFFIAFLCSFLWYFLPGYLFTALSVFSWVCWIRPKHKMINALFGYNHGLGMGFLTFDWSMIAYTSSPLVTPVSLLSAAFPVPEPSTDPLPLYRRLVVGRSKCLRLYCPCVLDHCPHSVLYVHSRFSLFFVANRGADISV